IVKREQTVTICMGYHHGREMASRAEEITALKPARQVCNPLAISLHTAGNLKGHSQLSCERNNQTEGIRSGAGLAAWNSRLPLPPVLTTEVSCTSYRGRGYRR
ncbi:Hypothetical predicted protein, partial [Marmota monax]